MSQLVRCPTCGGTAHYMNGFVRCMTCESEPLAPPVQVAGRPREPAPAIVDVVEASRSNRGRAHGRGYPVALLTLTVGVAIALGVILLAWALLIRTGTLTGVSADTSPSSVESKAAAKVRDYLAHSERGAQISQSYPPESLDDAYFWVGDSSGRGVWLDFQGNSPTQMANGYVGDKHHRNALEIAVRIVYSTSIGFDRSEAHDRVFLLTWQNELVGSLPTENFRIDRRQRGPRLDDIDSALGD